MNEYDLYREAFFEYIGGNIFEEGLKDGAKHVAKNFVADVKTSHAIEWKYWKLLKNIKELTSKIIMNWYKTADIENRFDFDEKPRYVGVVVRRYGNTFAVVRIILRHIDNTASYEDLRDDEDSKYLSPNKMDNDKDIKMMNQLIDIAVKLRNKAPDLEINGYYAVSDLLSIKQGTFQMYLPRTSKAYDQYYGTKIPKNAYVKK